MIAFGHFADAPQGRCSAPAPSQSASRVQNRRSNREPEADTLLGAVDLLGALWIGTKPCARYPINELTSSATLRSLALCRHTCASLDHGG